MFRNHFNLISMTLTTGALLAAGACTTTVNNAGTGTTNGADTTTGTTTGKDTAGGTGGATCPVKGGTCCVGDSLATGHLYDCPDDTAGMKCIGMPDPKCQDMSCLADPTCAAACAEPPKSDPSGCTEIQATDAEKQACCDKSGGGGDTTGGGGDTTGGNTDTGGGGGVTGVVWAGTWQVKLEYDVKCTMSLTNPKSGHESMTASVKISGDNTSLSLSDNSGNYQMTGTGHDDHASFNGQFPLLDAVGTPTSGLGTNGIQVTFNITTVDTKDKAHGDIEGSKFGGVYSGDPNCTVSNSTLVMTR